MSNNQLDHVQAQIYVDRKQVEFVSLELDQALSEHHTFRIVLDYDRLKDQFMNDPLKQMKLIGQFVDIDLQQGTDNANAYEFRGIIEDVSHSGEDGRHGYLIIQGRSTTALLERGRRLDIFSGMNLSRIFEEVTDGIINKKLSCVNSPVYDGITSFLMQYYESDWEFLQRLSAITGETLLYTGRDLVFGQYPDWEAQTVTYDKEITSFSFGSKLLPNNFTRYQYLPEQDDTIEQDAPTRIEGSNDYINSAADRSKDLTEKRPARTPLLFQVDDKGALDELVIREKTATASSTVYIKGKSKTCAPRIGRLLTINMPNNMPEAKELGTYRIVKVRHAIDESNTYKCEFEAVPASLKFYSTQDIKMPTADSICATVIKNDDPQGQGRVKVEFPFAKERVSETWLRVMSPNAGSSSEVSKNRGMVFIPEKGDQVMVGFEFGDPNRPYIMGSMFHGKNGQGGQQDNHIKSFITRRGNALEFDDADETLGIIIKDKEGDFIHIDAKGKNIEITALETITFNAKDIKMNASNNIEMQAEQAIKVDAMAEIHIGAQANVDIATESDIQIKSMGATNITAQTEMKIEGQAIEVTGFSKTEIAGKQTFVKGDITTVSGSGNKIEIV